MMDMSDYWIQLSLTILTTSIASGGMWAFITRQLDKRSAQMELLLGLAHDRIVWVGMGYRERGWITKDEYDDFIRYLYQPYAKFGGNGLADKIKQEVDKLPMHRHPPFNWRPETPYSPHPPNLAVITEYGRHEHEPPTQQQDV